MIRSVHRLRAYLRWPGVRAGSASLLLLLLLLPAWWQASRWYEDRLLREQQSQAIEDTSLRGSALSLAINRRLARLQGLHSFVQTELPSSDVGARFESFASSLYAGTYGIRALTVAPGAVVRYVYPRIGNESLLGSGTLQDPRPEVRADAQRAIDSGHIVVTGPIEFGPGEKSLIAQQAVYQDGAFWGLVGIVLDLSVMLDEADLTTPLGDLAFALRDSSGRVLYGSPAAVAGDAVIAGVELPEEMWELAGAPVEGWETSIQHPRRIFRGAGLIIMGLMVGLAYVLVSHEAGLAEAVRQRTSELSAVNIQLQKDIAERRRTEAALAEREAQYRSIFESTSDGLLILDLKGNLVDSSPAAAQMHGYSPEAFRHLAPHQFIHPDSQPLFARFLDEVKAGDQFRGRAVDLRQDGTLFHVEVLGTGFLYRGEPHALAIVRDITEELQAYRLLEQRVEERTQELATLLEVSANIASTLQLEPLLGLILEQLRTVVEYSGASVFLLEYDGLRSVAHRGPISQETLADIQLAQEDVADLWEAMQAQGPLIVGDVREEAWLAHAFRQAFGSHLDRGLRYVRTWMGVPLMAQEGMIGWLCLHHSDPHAYTIHQACLVETIANQAATAIENAQLYVQAQRVAVLEERQRLARELHDSVSQALYGIGLGARTAQKLLARSADEAELRSSLAEPVDYVLSLADAALAEMRSLIFELRPDALEKEGLVTALTRQADSLRARHHVEVHTEFDAEPDLPLQTKEALYRVAQEALHNIAKHAQATQVRICLSARADVVALEVQDDGVGFDPQAEYPGHMGLETMRERVAHVGGGLQINSAPGKGTRLLARIALSNSVRSRHQAGTEKP